MVFVEKSFLVASSYITFLLAFDSFITQTNRNAKRADDKKKPDYPTIYDVVLAIKENT